ncbi:hypothetical protein M407DRAFT_218194 [Tulasnella calospora MUT 4182]|uniref:Uncharacterized protein n=1 Tax=Tulasnella calospora MUT 4182 TaxID=1051891 RepID=A0A0C3LJ85_9AGAM|nr:hypothetical protein M407DRAFT_218194 [Tulasnella calospora MUT 4182]
MPHLPLCLFALCFVDLRNSPVGSRVTLKAPLIFAPLPPELGRRYIGMVSIKTPVHTSSEVAQPSGVATSSPNDGTASGQNDIASGSSLREQSRTSDKQDLRDLLSARSVNLYGRISFTTIGRQRGRTHQIPRHLRRDWNPPRVPRKGVQPKSSTVPNLRRVLPALPFVPPPTGRQLGRRDGGNRTSFSKFRPTGKTDLVTILASDPEKEGDKMGAAPAQDDDAAEPKVVAWTGPTHKRASTAMAGVELMRSSSAGGTEVIGRWWIRRIWGSLNRPPRRATDSNEISRDAPKNSEHQSVRHAEMATDLPVPA